MRPDRRAVICSIAAAAVSAGPRGAAAQAYPARPVRWVVGFTPGGGNDIVARLMGQWLQERLGQPFVIENRPGAASNIAADVVVNAPADGYTLLLANAANAINATYYENLSFDFIRDIAPVAGIGRFPYVMAVNPSFPANSVREFIDYAKANPGKVNMGTGGAGGPDDASAELLQLMTGIKMTHVPYRGTAPALTDLLAGQVQMVFSTIPAAIHHIKSGALRAIALTSATRLDTMPDIPTIGETVPGFESEQWYGVGAPAGTPAAVIATLNREVNAALADPKLKARIDQLGGVPLVMSPAEFGKFVARETEKMAKVIKAAGISVK